MSNRNSQVIRILRVIRILERNPQGITAENIHSSLRDDNIEVSIRSVYRDLEAIQQAHFPLTSENRDDGGHIWRFNAVAVLSGKIQISFDEITALYVSKECLEPLRGTAFYKDIKSFFEKIEKLLGPKVQDELKELRKSINFKATPMWTTGIPQEVLDVVHRACVEGHQITIDYKSNSDKNRGKVSSRKVGPMGLFLADSSIYLIAKDLADGVVKKFALIRIRSAQWSEDAFDVAKEFNADEYFKDDFGMLSVGTVQDVKIRVEEPIASYVAERRWHQSQVAIRKEDSSIELTMRVRVNQELARWVLGLGPAAEVVAPAELRVLVTELSASITKRYSGPKAA